LADEFFYTPNLKRAPLSIGQPGELLFEFVVDHKRFRFELRDHGEQYGVECPVFRDGEFWSSRHFDPRLDPTRLARDVAIVWAGEVRKLVEANPNAEIVA
jgi:hypothetical protein